MLLREIVAITRGRLVSGDPDTEIAPSKISTDSRTLERGDFFIALNGVNFDGNHFAKEAFRKGAIGAIITKMARKGIGRNLVLVRDAVKALGEIAAYHRRRFDIPLICVTGSNGKTTTKEMIWKVLSSRYNVLKNEGTRNNQIGVPQTLLKLKKGHEVCVLELGTNHKGEIRLLSGIAQPTIALITNIGPSHLEHLGTLKDVFRAKTEMLDSLAEGGELIINGDDKFLSGIRDRRFRIHKFGLGRSNDFRATGLTTGPGRIRFLLNGKKEFELNLIGLHNVTNALAAIAAGSCLGVSQKAMRESLRDYRPSGLRLNLKKVKGINIINDSYNSNPLSMKCALDALKAYPARAKWVVSGDMLELGRSARRFHEILGVNIARSGARGLLTLGRLSRYTFREAGRHGMARENLWHCSDHSEMAGILNRVAQKGDAVLIKGSRSMRMEKVAQILKGRE